MYFSQVFQYLKQEKKKKKYPLIFIKLFEIHDLYIQKVIIIVLWLSSVNAEEHVSSEIVCMRYFPVAKFNTN